MKYLLAITILFIISFISPTYSKAQQIKSETTNVVFIGNNTFRLFGFTSPYALVSLQGQSMYKNTYSDTQGYFEFNDVFTPLENQEPCIISIDREGRRTSPVCLAPFPDVKNVNIGPVILPPTISVNKNVYFSGDSGILYGKTIPNKQVELSFFVNSIFPDSLFSNSLATPVYAAESKEDPYHTLPPIIIYSDEQGNYSVTLPTYSAETFRIFSQVLQNGIASPKSNSLTIDIFPIWIIISIVLSFIVEFINKYIIMFIFLLELAVLLHILLLRKVAIHNKLMLRPQHELLLFKK